MNEVKRPEIDYPQAFVPDISQTLDDQQLTSFQEVFELCEKGAWDAAEKQARELDKVVNQQGRTILLEALHRGKTEIAEFLIDRNIAFRVTVSNKECALHYAARLGNTHLIEKIWKKAHHIDVANDKGQTPIHMAVENGHTHAVRELIANGANLKAMAEYSFEGQLLMVTPLQLAVIKGHRSCVEALMESPFAKDQVRTEVADIGHILHVAIHFRKPAMIELLLMEYFDHIKNLINSSNCRGEQPLMLAAFLGDRHSMEFLIQKEANLSLVDKDERTALHWAAWGKQKGAIELLVYYILNSDKVLLNARDNKGKTPDQLLEDHLDPESQNLSDYLRNLSKQSPQNVLPPEGFPAYLIENIVYQGGGAKGKAYLGVAKALEERGIMPGVKRIAGTSAGAIQAGAQAFGLLYAQIKRVLSDTELTELLDFDFPEASGVADVKNIFFTAFKGAGVFSPLGILNQLWHTTGLYKGERLRKWIEGIYAKASEIPNCTFGELRKLVEKGNGRYKHLHIFTSDLNTGKVNHINSEDGEWDDVIVSDAVRCSISIPGLFKPHYLYIKNKDGLRVQHPKYGPQVDGGMLCNYPIGKFDKRKYLSTYYPETGEYMAINPRTLGFSLSSPQENAPKPHRRNIETVGQLTVAILSMYYNAEAILSSQVIEHAARTVKINTLGVQTTEFGLSKERSAALANEGYKSTCAHLKKFEQRRNEETSFYIRERIALEARGAIRGLRRPLSTFHGRQTYLERIAAKLIQQDGNLHQVVLTGSEGMGKTETAITFANKHLKDFSLIWWFDSETVEGTNEAYRELADQLEIRSRKDVVPNVNKKLEEWSDEKPFLLIFDNLDNIERQILLPQRGNGAILITSRAQGAWDREEVEKMELFTPIEAVEAFRKTVPDRPDDEEMRKLVEQLDGFPLAIGQVGSYVAEKGVTIKYFSEHLAQRRHDALSQRSSSFPYKRSLASVWEATQEALSKECSEACSWLKICCFFESDKIPFEWIEGWLKDDEPNFTKRKMQIIPQLISYGIINCDMGDSVFAIHRLRKEIIVEALPEREKASSFHDAVGVIVAVGSKLDPKQPSHIEKFFKWELHARKVLRNRDIPRLEEAKILTLLGIWAKEKGGKEGLNDAKVSFLFALEIYESLPNRDRYRLEQSVVLNKLGEVYLLCGEHKLAQTQFEKVLQMHAMQFDMPAHRHFSFQQSDFYNLQSNEMHAEHIKANIYMGKLYYILGKHEQFVFYFDCAQAYATTVFEGRPSEVFADIKDARATIAFESNDVETAITLHDEALVIRKALNLNDQHPSVVQNYEDQILVLQASRKHKEAQDYFNKVEKTKTDLYGDQDHPQMVSFLFVAAKYYYNKNRIDEAFTFCRRASQMQSVLHRDSLEKARIRILMGLILLKKGRRTKSVEQLQKALKLFVKFCGESHPQTNDVKSLLECASNKSLLEMIPRSVRIGAGVVGVTTIGIYGLYELGKERARNRSLENIVKQQNVEVNDAKRTFDALRSVPIVGEITRLFKYIFSS